MERKSNRVIDIFIKSLLVFQVIVSIFIQIDRFLYDYGYIKIFVIGDFILDKYFSTKSVFWDILRTGYDFTFFLGYIIRAVAISLDIATEKSSLIIYNFIGIIIICTFLVLLQKVLNFILLKIKNGKKKQ